MQRWLQTCDVRDEHSQPVHLTPHRWRHTFATRLKVSGVALGASFGKIRELLVPATSPFELDQGRSVESSSHAS